MAFAVARTRDEAQLYLELTPCPDCGATDAPWEHSLVEIDGELTTSYAGICAGCQAEREYLFGLPARETPVQGWPTFGGQEPSELLDPGQWMNVADNAASAASLEPIEARTALDIARAAVEEVIKFVPPGSDAVPPEEFWTPEGLSVWEAEPGSFRLDRLLVKRDTYRAPAHDVGAN